ncbi:MAG TPA: NnrU family protein [Caulifigura sp.]|nr:NnrU family protein [Caulifigura sp.]
MKRWLVLLSGVVSYVLFLATFVYLAGFVAGFLTPTRLDGPLTVPLIQALAVDALLILVFGLQHSVMARPGFKKWITRSVPQPTERTIYVLASNAAMGLLFWQWQPLGGIVWNVQSTAGLAVAWTLFAIGWLAVLATTFLINHFDLFGLRQVWLYFRGRPCEPLRFVTPGPYRHIRHPLYMGWMIAFWATPTMTLAHLVFAIGMTSYMLIAIVFEERDLMRAHADYATYRAEVPMLIPNFCELRKSQGAGEQRRVVGTVATAAAGD